MTVVIRTLGIGVNPEGSRPSDFGMEGSPLNILISYNVQEYEIRTYSKVETFQK